MTVVTDLKYFIVYKPADMISQFVSPYDQRLLKDLDFKFPEGIHAVGRLDEQSEGLLILTTDKKLTRRLLHPHNQFTKRYLVQVLFEVEDETIKKLSSGIEIIVKQKGPYVTKPCSVKLLKESPALPPRQTSYIEYKPHSWLEFILTEGKNRQIRKMCKAVNHECKRLVRTHINNLSIGDMQPGEVRELEKEELFELLLLS
jgi:23S rRNA pseudouridine2457 synthase